MAQRTRVPLGVRRFKNFMLILLKNRMAFTGLFVLALFSSLAAAASLVTPYDPLGTVVSGQFAPPSWVTLISGDAGTSQNAGFSGLNAQASPDSVRITTTLNGEDSIDVAVELDHVSNARLLVTKTSSYPYKGPPDRLIGTVKITPTGLGSLNTATAKIGVEKGPATSISSSAPATCGFEGSTWVFWGEKLSASRVYVPPYGGGRFDSNDLTLNECLGLSGTVFSAAEVIFDKAGLYTYFIDISLPPGPAQLSFSIREFKMSLLGNTWGLLGTDFAGHDIFTQLAYGARVSLAVGFLATGIGVGAGLLVGLIAGYLGKLVDEVLMRFTDMMLVVPGLPLLIVLVAVLGSSIWNIIMILGFLGWMGFARVVRSQVLSLKERPFIEAAKAAGAGTGYITMRHIFPNIVSLTYVNLALSVPAAIVGEAALSFLGLGDPTIVSWGKMLEEARAAGSSTNLLWWWVVPPGAAIAALSLSFILLGYALDEIFNPKLRRRR